MAESAATAFQDRERSLPDSPVPRPRRLPRRSLSVRLIRRARRVLRRAFWSIRLVVSAFVLIGVLAVLAAVPLLDIYVLGYLLAAEGRVGRGERWRNVLPWVRNAPRIAAIAFGTAVTVLPLWILSDVSRDAALVNPEGAGPLRWTTTLLTLLTALHLFFAYARGGSLMSFVRPVKNVRLALRRMREGSFGRSIADRLTSALRELQIPSLLWLGARGLAIAVAWLFLPCALIAAAGPADAGRLFLKFGGTLLLTAVFPLLLILQAHFATTNRLRAGFALREALRRFGRAPVAWLIAGTLTAVLALPLFLFKIVAPPRDAFWMLTPLFVAAMLPARVVTGWAYRRAARRQRRRSIAAIAFSLVGVFLVGFIYSAGVLAAQYVNEHGRHAVFEQHAFSLPVPF